MALIYDLRGLPECCGIGLIPGEPHTQCPRCHARYDTAMLAQGMTDARMAHTLARTCVAARRQTMHDTRPGYTA